mmetsp:Transcript_4143/g.6405  ORF Transcript_4143/g.6405 Transcript_4143/m.6405 type:complete len:111 (+) Transcript_4143:296-628(+)
MGLCSSMMSRHRITWSVLKSFKLWVLFGARAPTDSEPGLQRFDLPGEIRPSLRTLAIQHVRHRIALPQRATHPTNAKEQRVADSSLCHSFLSSSINSPFKLVDPRRPLLN